MITRLDAAILARIERASHWMYVHHGLNCFALARLGHIATVFILALVGRGSAAPGWPFFTALMSFSVMYLRIVWSWYADMESYYESLPDVAHQNTLRWREQIHDRALGASIIFYVLAGWLYTMEHRVLGYALGTSAWVLVLYLQACIPGPPGDRQKWLEEQELRNAIPHPA